LSSATRKYPFRSASTTSPSSSIFSSFSAMVLASSDWRRDGPPEARRAVAKRSTGASA